MIVVGIVMAIVEKTARHERPIEVFHPARCSHRRHGAVLALVPGTSRSGITLIAAMLLGFRRDASARFSFLLSIPAVAAAGVFELPKLIRDHEVGTTALATGLLVAAVSGYLSVAWLLRFLRTHTTYGFVVYRVIFGLGLIAAVIGGMNG